MTSHDFLSQTGQSLLDAGTQVWNSFVGFLPQLIGAIIIILVGWIAAKILKHAVVMLLEHSTLDKWVEEQNLTAAIGGKKISQLVGSITKWFVIAIFLSQAVATFNLMVLGSFLARLADYIVLFLVAVVIVSIGLIVGRYVRHSVEATEHMHKRAVGMILEIVLVYMALVIGLQNLGLRVDVLVDLFRIAFTGFTLTIAIIVGLGFGLAFKDQAKDILGDISKDWKATKK
ncbi:MAG: hypothetical protein Q7S92_01300 [Candidatus Diapherotrites archaeon]|nr:hypothetical protein [Candidatus Diapherotrites archaeon]